MNIHEPIRAIILAALLALAFPALAQDKPAIETQFRVWLEQSLWPAAKGQGVSRQSFDAAFAGVKLNWKLPDLVPPGTEAKTPREQFQSEFRAPARYFDEATLASVIAGGATRLPTHAATIAALERQYGVPGRFLLAIWGRESGFGRANIPYDAFEVLGTKAFLSTRAEMFTQEVLAALVMLEKGVKRSAMKGSWAGALGQPQFMPTSFLKFAADGDGDGKTDIWNSEADTLASIASFLARSGWTKGRDWGFEVGLPAGVSCSLEGPDRGKPLEEWIAQGIARVNGRAFPPGEQGKEMFLLTSAGRNGPAFLVTPNFYAFKQYNESDLYALFIGHAGDRIQHGGGSFAGKWSAMPPMLRSDIAAMQRGLEKLGYDVGGADGLPGFKTRRSIGQWQRKQGLPETCFPSKRALAALEK
jgi:lytic murein transglycosylase